MPKYILVSVQVIYNYNLKNKWIYTNISLVWIMFYNQGVGKYIMRCAVALHEDAMKNGNHKC